MFALVSLYSMLLLGDWEWDSVAVLASASFFGFFRREGTGVVCRKMYSFYNLTLVLLLFSDNHLLQAN